MDDQLHVINRMQTKSHTYNMDEILSRGRSHYGPLFFGMTAINYEEDHNVSWNWIYRELNQIGSQGYNMKFIQSKVLNTNRQYNGYIASKIEKDHERYETDKKLSDILSMLTLVYKILYSERR